MSDIVISVENLSKSYLVGHNAAQAERYTALRDVVSRNARSLARKTRDMFNGRAIVQGDVVEEFWALKEVSFEVKKGDRVGIIGRNGAGKSTLLKILSRITEPTAGRVKIAGRMASLLEVGTGFHPELSGRENIFLNGAILGMNRKEIKRKFDEIVDFAEVERFLDTPVKRYSSGMYVRLAFAVAAHLEPDILIVDEVLAVGDAQFQKKCLGKMETISKNEGKTLIFVSHNMNALNALCSSAILLENGVIKHQGEVSVAIERYLVSHTSTSMDISNYRVSKSLEDVHFKKIIMKTENSQILLNGNINFRLSVYAKKKIENISIGGTIFNSMGSPVGAFVTNEFNIEHDIDKDIDVEVVNTKLAPGLYYMGFSLGIGNFKNTSRADYDVVIGIPAFEILPYNAEESIGVWNMAWGNIVYDASAKDDINLK